MGPKLQNQGINEEEIVEGEELIEPQDGEVESDEPQEVESAEESAREALRELQEQAKAAGGEGEEEPEAEPGQGHDSEPVQEPVLAKENKSTKGKKIIEAEELEPEPGTEPPLRFKAHEKEWFAKIQHKGLKRSINRSFSEMESLMTRTTQEAAKREKEAGSIIEAVRPYVDQFTAINVPVAQGIAQLCLVQKKLTDTSNPKQQRETLLAIARDIGVDLNASEESQGGEIPDISNHPVVRQLIEQNNRLQEMVEPIYNQNKQTSEARISEESAKILSELEGVQHEADAYGNYKRRELVEDADFLERWKAQTKALNGTAFGKTWADAGKNAYRILKGQAPMESSQLNQSRIPAANNNNKHRVASNVISVRGRSAPLSSTTREMVDVPSNETPLQSAMAALADLQGRG